MSTFQLLPVAMMRLRVTRLLHFLYGVTAGVSVGLVSVSLLNFEQKSSLNSVPALQDQNYFRNNVAINRRSVGYGPEFAKPNDTFAKQLEQKIRVLCWLYLRNTRNFKERMNISMSTWGKKCAKFLIFIDKHDEELKAVGLDKIVKSSIKWSSSPTILINRYVYHHFGDQLDWVLHAESVPYVIMENLRHFLSNKDPDEPGFYGHRMNAIPYEVRFTDSCAGTALSRGTLRMLATRGSDVPVCNYFRVQLGVQLARCLSEMGLNPGETRDVLGRSRFLLFDIGFMMTGEKLDLKDLVDDETYNGKLSESVSTSLISFGRSDYWKNTGHNFFIYDLIKVGEAG